jgi:hypothetical protein
MINLTANNPFISKQRVTSFTCIYPKTITLYVGNYTKLNILHNLKLKIKNNLSERNKNFTYVRGEMTDWNFLKHDKDFSVFFTEIMDQYRPIIGSDFIYNKELHVMEAWGNLLKKGDHVALHAHNSWHGILYLTEGTPLIFPELEINFTPKIGDWIISPSGLLHGTEKIESDEERINVVFNFDFKDNFRIVNEKF